jgi:phage host-nuclease inhibitor protein Gam
MELKTWEDAEVAGTEFAELTSQLEILKEQLREFCERRHDAVGKARVVGPVLVGFRKEAACVAISDQPSAIRFVKRALADSYIRTIEEIDRRRLKNFMQKLAGEARLDQLREAGITLRAATEKFYVKLARDS